MVKKQKTPEDINIFLSDYFKSVAMDDIETRNQLIEDGKEMTANYTDLARAFHTFVSTINPQIDLLSEISDTKFDILVNVLKDSKALTEESEEELKGLLGNLEDTLNSMNTSELGSSLLQEVYEKELKKEDKNNNEEKEEDK